MYHNLSWRRIRPFVESPGQTRGKRLIPAEGDELNWSSKLGRAPADKHLTSNRRLVSEVLDEPGTRAAVSFAPWARVGAPEKSKHDTHHETPPREGRS
jgi:hypothetical protein